MIRMRVELLAEQITRHNVHVIYARTPPSRHYVRLIFLLKICASTPTAYAADVENSLRVGAVDGLQWCWCTQK